MGAINFHTHTKEQAKL